MVIRRNVFFLFLAACLFITDAVGANGFAFAQQDNDKETYRIDIGDVLEVHVWQEDALSKEVFVRLDGRISLPLIGDVVAAGKTSMELSRILGEKLSELVEEPSVSVLIKESNSRIYYMVGNINKPGVYPINTPVNLLQAIAKAGGLGEWADKDDIIIVRRINGKDEMLSFDYDDFVKGKDLSKNIMIHYGDTIIVP